MQGIKELTLSDDGTIPPEGLATFLFDLYVNHSDWSLDSRVLLHFMKRNLSVPVKQTYSDIPAFAQRSQRDSEGGAFEWFDLRTGRYGDVFLMLNNYQSAVVAMREIFPLDIACEEIEVALADFLFSTTPFRYDRTIGLISLSLFVHMNRTMEEIVDRQALKKNKSGLEKHIENTLASQLRNQGITVRQQVSCDNGRADIVTPDAIYEVKAVLTRGDLHAAIGQVLSYQVCINPSANLFIVGRRPKEEEVEVDLAKSLGIEVIIWEDQPVTDCYGLR